jgi:O-Antigen ligase.
MVVMSDSRSALLSISIGSLILFNFKFNLNVLLCFSLPLITLSFIPLLVVVNFETIATLYNPKYISILERFYLWHWAYSIFQESNLVGGGFGIPLYTGEISWQGELISYPYAHNVLLNILGWSGLLGLFYLFFIYYFIIKAGLIGFENRNYTFPQSLIFFTFSWSILDGGMQGMWVTHLVFLLSVALILKPKMVL